MFYYMKFRIGVCIPSTCHQGDMDSISSALSSSLRLNITIPDCRVKQSNVPLTRAQFVAGTIFALVLGLVFCATLFDCFKMKWQRIKHQERVLRNHFASGKYALSDKREARALSNHFQIIKIQRHQADDETSSAGSRFEDRFGKHWSWMSFSLLTNFRLYFQERNVDSTNDGHNGWHQEAGPNGKTLPGEQLSSVSMGGHINCLDGIRVLSLCWVIIANSYLTLDPRATKRLTKTREAPRDFLFQLVVQASLAIETFFFLSGLLMSLSFARRLRPCMAPSSNWRAANESPPSRAQHHQARPGLMSWIHFYIHRYVRMTPPTMLVIALSMYAYHLGDGPLWFEATQRVHQSCSQNWWRHLLHVANFIDTRQMCFIHYWYIAADMQLFLFAPALMFLLYKCRRLGYALIALIGSASMALVFQITYDRNLPPTLLFYNTDPE